MSKGEREKNTEMNRTKATCASANKGRNSLPVHKINKCLCFSQRLVRIIMYFVIIALLLVVLLFFSTVSFCCLLHSSFSIIHIYFTLHSISSAFVSSVLSLVPSFIIILFMIIFASRQYNNRFLFWLLLFQLVAYKKKCVHYHSVNASLFLRCIWKMCIVDFCWTINNFFGGSHRTVTIEING